MITTINEWKKTQAKLIKESTFTVSLRDVSKATDILKDLRIKQDDVRNSDVFTIPEDMEEEVVDIFLSQNIEFTKESLDKVGEEDKDINNDGEVNKQDDYLANRRKTISANIGENNEPIMLDFNDFVIEHNKCISLTISDPDDKFRTNKFDIIRLAASNSNCEIIGTFEDKIIIASKDNNEGDLEDFTNNNLM